MDAVSDSPQDWQLETSWPPFKVSEELRSAGEVLDREGAELLKFRCERRFAICATAGDVARAALGFRMPAEPESNPSDRILFWCESGEPDRFLIAASEAEWIATPAESEPGHIIFRRLDGSTLAFRVRPVVSLQRPAGLRPAPGTTKRGEEPENLAGREDWFQSRLGRKP